ncbi:hypothetical protein WH50_05625 [Pokkaliibacter plantistimulans]|uniref:Peptidase M50 domain-containing protein n=1 Tax=Pokkaliibacter plantistimulans TaxID=1635171 RepID=A0ABX5M139_9GAMM|nr:site-2 protease family protein [Pokkaliibacter plantistimulans]PXF32207.1 hypothetical protein WH50_05625 [Pokkaliibacter plantistimulans]
MATTPTAPSWRQALDQQSLTTAILTWAAFAWLTSPKSGLLLLLVIFVHELGHMLMLWKMTGLVAKIRFIPFFGGVTVHRGGALTPFQRGWFAIGGPGLGTLFAIACALLFQLTGWREAWYLAVIGLFLNALNLIPLPPLDGGQITELLNRKLWALGALLALAALYFFHSTWTLVIIGLLLWQAWQYYQRGEPNACERCHTPYQPAVSTAQPDAPHARVTPPEYCSRCGFPQVTSASAKRSLWSGYLGVIGLLLCLAYWLFIGRH